MRRNHTGGSLRKMPRLTATSAKPLCHTKLKCAILPHDDLFWGKSFFDFNGTFNRTFVI